MEDHLLVLLGLCRGQLLLLQVEAVLLFLGPGRGGRGGGALWGSASCSIVQSPHRAAPVEKE